MANERIIKKTESEVLKKIKSIGNDGKPLPQGQAQINISPFDDYISFTIFTDGNDANDIPLDLTNLGTLYLSFIGSKDEIRIPNYTQLNEIDSAGGQVVFRISKNDSKRIIALDKRTFWISSRLEVESDASDESVLYSGKWIEWSKGADQDIIDTVEEIQNQAAKEIAKLQNTINDLKSTINKLESKISDQSLLIQGYQENNSELANAISDIKNEVGNSLSGITKPFVTLDKSDQLQSNTPFISNNSKLVGVKNLERLNAQKENFMNPVRPRNKEIN